MEPNRLDERRLSVRLHVRMQYVVHYKGTYRQSYFFQSSIKQYVSIITLSVCDVNTADPAEDQHHSLKL